MAAAGPPAPARSWAAVPPPIRHLFDLFPLSVLPAEPLPARAPARSRPRPALYVFGRGDPSAGRPSFNPSCLKWQTFLRIAGVQVDHVHSNNHASPSGALPFLLPPTPSSTATSTSITTPSPSATPSSSATSTSQTSSPLTGAQIARYARAHSDIPPDSPRAEPYAALIAQRIRPAWLYTLYILPANLPLLSALYLPPSPLLALPALRALRAAATAEILTTTRRPSLSPAPLLSDARDALAALSTLLADDAWFFGNTAPGLFDAELFAYTHLVLDERLGWADDSLSGCVAAFENLVRHRERLYRRCWPEEMDALPLHS